MTLSAQTIETVQATIPFLAENGSKLTQHFYKRMFEHHPEVRPFFNQAHQHDHTQQRALAGAICKFAQHIHEPEQLAGAITLIANKHASLQVQPEHYPIVGEHLLASIDELLNPAPQSILDAWAEAYQFLANVLIEAERGIYHQQADHMHGWNGFQKLKVVNKQQESDHITAFTLAHPDGTLPNFLPGQFVTVRIPSQDGSTTMRNYSLSGSPAWDTYRLSIKRETHNTHDGYASNWIHNNLTVGDEIEIAPPCGSFVLNTANQQRDIVLLAGGVGLTPLLSMLHASEGQAFQVDFVHANTSPSAHAHRQEVIDLCNQHNNLHHHFLYEEPMDTDIEHQTGRLNLSRLEQLIDASKDVFLCGPKPMMTSALSMLAELNHPQDQIHFEFFGPQE